jgi:hypothetical protein
MEENKIHNETNQIQEPPKVADENYIMLMAGMLEIDPNREEVRNLVTKALTKAQVSLELAALKQTINESNKKKLSSEQLTKISSMVTREQSSAARSLQNDIDSYYSSVARYLKDADSYLKAMTEKRIELEHYLNRPVDLSSEVSKIVDDGFYSVAAVYENYIRFATQPVTLVENNPAAGIKRSVFLGTFFVTYHPNTGVIKVTGKESNIETQGHIHPHIGSGGSVCWGTAAEAVAVAMRDLRPSVAFKALQVILNNYNGSSPYRTIERFMERSNNVTNSTATVDTYVNVGYITWGEHDDRSRLREVSLMDYERNHSVEEEENEDGDMIEYNVRSVEVYRHGSDESTYYARTTGGEYINVDTLTYTFEFFEND